MHLATRIQQRVLPSLLAALLALGLGTAVHAKPKASSAKSKKPVATQSAKKAAAAKKAVPVKRAAAAPVTPRPVSARMAEVRRAQLALAGFGDEDFDSAVATTSRENSHGRRSGLQFTTDPLGLNSTVGLVMDAQTGELLYSKNDNAVLPIASITKLMTATVIAEAGLPMDEAITVSDADIDRIKGSSSRLKVGTTLSRGEMLLLALMSSENRAAHALARTFPGGSYNFVRYMNQKARDLGMSNTHYVDSSGLSNENRSSAQDLAKLIRYASNNGVVRSYSTFQEFEINDVDGRPLTYRNTNGFVRTSSWPMELQKTGFIREAGRCIVMQTPVNGRSVLMVLLDATTTNNRMDDAQRLRTWLENGGAGSRYAVSPQYGNYQTASYDDDARGNIMRAMQNGY